MRDIEVQTEDGSYIINIKFEEALLPVCESSGYENKRSKANALCDEWARICNDKCREDKHRHILSGLMLDILIKTFCEIEQKLGEAYKDRTKPASPKSFDVDEMLKATSRQHSKIYESMSSQEQKNLRNYIHLGAALAIKHMESKEKNMKNKTKGIIKVDYNYSLNILSFENRDLNAIKIMKNDKFLLSMSSFAEETMLSKGIRSDQVKSIVNESGGSCSRKGYCTVSSLISLFAAASLLLFSSGEDGWKSRYLNRDLKIREVRTEMRVGEEVLDAFILRPPIQSIKSRLGKPKSELLFDTLRENIVVVSDGVREHPMQSPWDKDVSSIFDGTDAGAPSNRESAEEISGSVLYQSVHLEVV